MNLKPWLIATRPKTLPASLMPVLIGCAAAFSDHHIDYPIMAVTLACALLIQIITNYVNEFYDFKKGADTEERLGPDRMVAMGRIAPSAMKRVSGALIVFTFLLGLVIVAHAGWVILLIGVLCLLFAYAYTGGPYPLAYHGVADIFVFIFFGVVATSGTFYAQTGYFSAESLVASFAPGFFSMNILGVNNYRDIDTDVKAGKNTLSVRLGKKRCLLLYTLITILAYCVPLMLLVMTGKWLQLLPLLSMPLAVRLNKDLRHKSGKELNQVLAGTGKLLLIFGILLCLGFVL